MFVTAKWIGTGPLVSISYEGTIKLRNHCEDNFMYTWVFPVKRKISCSIVETSDTYFQECSLRELKDALGEIGFYPDVNNGTYDTKHNSFTFDIDKRKTNGDSTHKRCETLRTLKNTMDFILQNTTCMKNF